VFLVREAGILKLDRQGLRGLEFLETDISFLAPDELWMLPQLMKKVRARLWVSTTFSSVPTWLMPCPWLIAIHDLNHLKWGGIGQKLYYRRLLRPFARKAARVLTVSEFSRRELSGWLKISREEIHLACNALDPAVSHAMTEGELDAGLARFGLERDKFFLLLTNPKPHKNAAVLIGAWREWADWQEERGIVPIPLVVSFPAPIDGGVKGVKYVGGLGSREARQLVRSARTLFFPSLYEGFGLPPVEAIAQGTPVCVSSILPHREGLAETEPLCIRWVTEPGSQAAWVAAIEEISKAPLLKPSLYEQRRMQLRFSPEKLAESWVQEIDQALGFEKRGERK
jgi:glycosyltransferase involved in cell wall biosynthesis